jgi:hypothetical protein
MSYHVRPLLLEPESALTQRLPVGRIGVLEPPYRALELRAAGPLSLGSVLVLDLGEGEPALEEAIIWQGQAPWCPLALVVRGVPATAGVLQLLTRLHGPLAFVDRSADRTAPSTREVLNAVQRRADRDPEAMFSYVSNRLGLTSLQRLFREANAFADPRPHLHETPAPRQVSRRLLALGPLGVRDWRWLFQLARLSGAGQVPIEELARRHGVGARSFRAQVQRYTGVATKSFREWVGWEWVIEAALRRWGYLDKEVSRQIAEEAS